MPARTARRGAPHDAPADVLRWGLCFAVIVAVHAGAALALLHYMQPADAGFVAGAAVVMIDLPEIPAAMPTPRNDLAPGPEEPPSEAVPKPKEEETKPPEQMTEVPLPEPEPPKPEPPAEERQATAPPPVTAVPAEAPSNAGVELPQPPSPAVLRRWQSGLSAQISRFKRYPPKADERRERGTAKVTFRIDDDGRVIESRILESSGWPHLDEEALLTVARAQPYPKPPSGTKPEDHWIIFPMVYTK